MERLVCCALVGKKYIKTGINHKTIEKEKRSNDYVLYMVDFKLYDKSLYVLTNKICCTEMAFVKKNVVHVQHFYYFCTVKLNTIWTHYSERVTGC